MLTYDLTARGRKTMYEYLYEAMKADILSGRLTAGEKLPSKRAFAEHLQVSVKTVENTYEQLLLEGYIRSEEKRGYFVNRLEVKNVSAPAYASFVTRFREKEYLADLTANNIQYDKFPFATWAKIMRQTLTDYDTSLLKTVPFNGVEKLRVAIAEHLYRYRGMHVSPDHIIVGAGTEYLYSRLLQLLGKNAKFGVENPGYRKITKLYDVGGVTWDYVDIDGQGMKVEQLDQKGITVAHVSPEHHFPIGLVMPVGIFIGTTLRGSAKGSGRAMYIMRTKRKNGSDYEAAPQIVEYDNTTESESVLRAIRDALQRLHYACTVVIHTECSYVASAITQHWPEKWQRNGWKSAKGNPVKNAVLWEMLLQDVEDGGHILLAEGEKHEYAEWMRFNMPLKRALKDIFTEVPKN